MNSSSRAHLAVNNGWLKGIRYPLQPNSETPTLTLSSVQLYQKERKKNTPLETRRSPLQLTNLGQNIGLHDVTEFRPTELIPKRFFLEDRIFRLRTKKNERTVPTFRQ